MQKYKSIQGDTWDIISFIAYSNEHYVDRLIAANMELRNIALFPSGVEVNLPDIDTASEGNSLLPPWKQ